MHSRLAVPRRVAARRRRTCSQWRGGCCPARSRPSCRPARRDPAADTVERFVATTGDDAAAGMAPALLKTATTARTTIRASDPVASIRPAIRVHFQPGGCFYDHLSWSRRHSGARRELELDRPVRHAGLRRAAGHADVYAAAAAATTAPARFIGRVPPGAAADAGCDCQTDNNPSGGGRWVGAGRRA